MDVDLKIVAIAPGRDGTKNEGRAGTFPWRSQVNFNGQGGCRMIDANNVEMPLLSIIAFSGIMTATIVVQEGQAAQYHK